MPTADVAGVRLEYTREGSGEPILLIMGLGTQSTAWPDPFVAGLVDAGFEVITFDNRDVGLSSQMDWTPPSPLRSFLGRVFRRPVDTGYLIEDMADDAAGLLDVLGIGRAHVVGASMGGMIAQALTIRHPDKVASLTSIMSNPGDGSGSIDPKLLPFLVRRPPRTPQNAVDESVEQFRRISGPHFDPVAYRAMAQTSFERSFSPEGVARQTAAIMASPSRVEGLRRVTTPTLVIHGLVDPLVRPSGGIATARAVAGSRLLMFPDMGHDLPAPRVDEMVDAIARNARRGSERQSMRRP